MHRLGARPSASSLCARHSSRMAGLAASRPPATTSSVGAVAPPATSATVCSVASASTIMIATSPSGRARPATTMSKVARASSSWVGNATHWPSTCAIRVAPIGPENGRPDSLVDSEAALIATTSYGCCGSSARMVSTTWTSLRRPLTNDGPQRPVDQPAGEDRVLAGPALAAEERAGDAARPRTSAPRRRPSAGRSRTAPSGACRRWWPTARRCRRAGRCTEPAACRASRPVEKVISRVPKAPLSITAVLCVVPRVVCSVMCGYAPSVVRPLDPAGSCSAAGLRSKRPGGR